MLSNFAARVSDSCFTASLLSTLNFCKFCALRLYFRVTFRGSCDRTCSLDFSFSMTRAYSAWNSGPWCFGLRVLARKLSDSNFPLRSVVDFEKRESGVERDLKKKRESDDELEINTRFRLTSVSAVKYPLGYTTTPSRSHSGQLFRVFGCRSSPGRWRFRLSSCPTARMFQFGIRFGFGTLWYRPRQSLGGLRGRGGSTEMEKTC